MQLYRCVFVNNTAYRTGAAISFNGAIGSTLLLQDTIFDRNAVEVPTDGRTTDITVLLYT